MRKSRYIVWLLAISAAFSTVLGAITLAYYLSLHPNEAVIFQQLAVPILLYGVIGLVLIIWITAGILKYLFANYVEPLSKVTEEIELISSVNPGHRIQEVGARDLSLLAGAVNAFAEKVEHLRLGGGQPEDPTILENRNRLEALMSEILNGVIVCNLDGQILLYNHQALELFRGNSSETYHEGLPGLGRSVFALLERKPLMHGLASLSSQLSEGQLPAFFSFVAGVRAQRFFRVNMAPVFAGQEKADTNGYVLTLEDITQEIHEISRRDLYMQSLSMSLESSLGRIVTGLGSMEAQNSRLPPELRSTVSEILDASGEIQSLIDGIAAEHADRPEGSSNGDHIMSGDFMRVLRDNISEKPNVTIEEEVDDELWLYIKAYTTLRGVIYLIGQLKAHARIQHVELRIVRRLHNSADLILSWEGEAISHETIRQWKECPMLVRGREDRSVTLEEMLESRGGAMPGGLDSTMSVTFPLPLAEPSRRSIEVRQREPRPVYYEFNLFERDGKSEEIGERRLSALTCVVFDTETTGLDPTGGDEIISLAGVRIIHGRLFHAEKVDFLIRSNRRISEKSFSIHGISDQMLEGQPDISSVLPVFHKFCEGAVLVAHNAAFDMRFLQLKEEETGIRFDQPVLDTLLLSSILHPNQELHNLEDIAARLGVEIVGRHTALGDAIVTAEIFIRMTRLLREKGIHTLSQAVAASAKSVYSRTKF